MKKIIGRKRDLDKLRGYYDSGKPEFVAIYGRRRVGKTFLVDACFERDYDFYVSGVIEGSKSDQLYNFNQALHRYGTDESVNVKTWNDAFEALRQLLEQKLHKKRVLVFIDELPCLDTPRSGFVKAFDSFWNTWGSKHPQIMLVVCGSATSWMVEKIIDSHGGLHNRITHEMHLRPFCLAETEEFLKNAGFRWNRLTIAQCYMTLGGIPYYLSLLRKDESLAQNIDSLFFAEDGALKREFQRLFHALFRRPEKYLKVIECLAKSRSGMSRSELIKAADISSGEDLTRVLRNLESCDFIRSFSYSGKPGNSNGRFYQVTDFFTLFHLKFCKNPTTDTQWWVHNLGRSVENDWYGIMYELLSITHIEQIKTALGISGIYTEYAGWRSKKGPKVQIDLLIDRADNIINLCEIKYSKGEYAIDKSEAEKLTRREEVYEEEVKPKKGIQPVLITTMGLRRNKYSGMIYRVVTLNDLFRL